MALTKTSNIIQISVYPWKDMWYNRMLLQCLNCSFNFSGISTTVKVLCLKPAQLKILTSYNQAMIKL